MHSYSIRQRLVSGLVTEFLEVYPVADIRTVCFVFFFLMSRVDIPYSAVESVFKEAECIIRLYMYYSKKRNFITQDNKASPSSTEYCQPISTHSNSALAYSQQLTYVSGGIPDQE